MTILFENGLTITLTCTVCAAVSVFVVAEGMQRDPVTGRDTVSKGGILSSDLLACPACNATVDVSTLSAA